MNVRPGKKSVIICIEPDSDSDIIIEEEEGDFKSCCVIVKGEKEESSEEEAIQGDDKRSEATEAASGQEMTLQMIEQKDPDETISSTSTQDFD